MIFIEKNIKQINYIEFLYFIFFISFLKVLNYNIIEKMFNNNLKTQLTNKNVEFN
jgi:hypothetical protein